MNSLTQFKIFKKIPILPPLIPLIFACFAPTPTAQAITHRNFPHARKSSEKISIQMITLIDLFRL